MGTDALDDIVDGGHQEAVRDIDLGHGDVRQAEGAVTLLAEEVNMQVIILVVAMAVAEFIAHAVTAILYDMHQMMLTEESERTKDARLVDGQYLILQFGERQRPSSLRQRPDNDNPVGCRFDAVERQ